MKSSQLLDLQYSLIFIDCDLYDGYLTTLEYGWERLKKGGLIFLDEYYSLKFPGARIATNSFLSKIDDKSFELEEVSDVGDDFERWVIRKL
jgi:predicted O-methyltransferase YrrM